MEETLKDIANLEETLQENVKGILASTMKEELSQLVKESLNEAEDEDETNIKDDDSDTLEDNSDTLEDDSDTLEDNPDGLEDDSDMKFADNAEDEDPESDDDTEEDMLDLTNASDEEVLKVFKAMKNDDSIMVKKENGKIHLTDNDDDAEYIIDLKEQEEANDDVILKAKDDLTDEDDNYISDEDEDDDYISDEDEDDYFSDEDEDDDYISDEDEDDYFSDEDELMDNPSMKKSHRVHKFKYNIDESSDEDDVDAIIDKVFKTYDGTTDEDLYEIEMDDNNLSEETQKKAFKVKKFKGKNPESETRKNPKLGKKPTKETGKPKIGELKKVTIGGKPTVKEPKEVETEVTEAPRTLGSGRRFSRRGLDKPRSAPLHLKNMVESLKSQVVFLEQKNEEYKKALNIFRTKLNEVATFNSNLAYATKLFTENSTTKEEKINILRRFDNVESLKESKALYKTIKEELNSKDTEMIGESIGQKFSNEPKTGSSANLIESKIYENPDFQRITELMKKMK